jgi:hypothetical protein
LDRLLGIIQGVGDQYKGLGFKQPEPEKHPGVAHGGQARDNSHMDNARHKEILDKKMTDRIDGVDLNVNNQGTRYDQILARLNGVENTLETEKQQRNQLMVDAVNTALATMRQTEEQRNRDLEALAEAQNSYLTAQLEEIQKRDVGVRNQDLQRLVKESARLVQETAAERDRARQADQNTSDSVSQILQGLRKMEESGSTLKELEAIVNQGNNTLIEEKAGVQLLIEHGRDEIYGAGMYALATTKSAHETLVANDQELQEARSVALNALHQQQALIEAQMAVKDHVHASQADMANELIALKEEG